jgi:hypothetical protein
MTDKDNQRIGSLFERCVTRREMLLTTGGALAGILLVGCGGGAGEQKSASPVAGTFVGDVSDPVASVAVVAGEPAQGEESREVRALIYGERENNIDEWFVGSAEGNALRLSSADGAELVGALTPEGATGTITLPDETSVPFDAILATGVAGFYDVTITPDRLVRGTSSSGARLEGQLEEGRARQLEGETREHSIVPLTGTLTAPDGETQDFEVDFAVLPPKEPEEPAQGRFIVLPDGTMRGGARKGTSDAPTREGDSAAFVVPLMD